MKGDMVIIEENNLSPMKWPIGIIVNVFCGGDGVVRVAEVKTSTGLFKRAIHRLAPLFAETQNGASTHKNPM